MEDLRKMIKKVISGGQTGADIGGLIGAEMVGVETGGWMPKGFLTCEGAKPELGRRFNLKETDNTRYPPRTAMNVRDSDGTIIFGFPSPGTNLTVKLCNQYKKQYLRIRNTKEFTPKDLEIIQKWIIRHKIETLNVAGNRESRNKGIEKFVTRFISSLLTWRKV